MAAVETFAGSDFRLVWLEARNRVSVFRHRGETTVSGHPFNFPYEDSGDVFLALKSARDCDEVLIAIDQMGGVPC